MLLKLAIWLSGRVRRPSRRPREHTPNVMSQKLETRPVTELRLGTKLHEVPAHISGKTENRTDLLRYLLIFFKLIRHDDEMWAALLGLSNEHAGSDAKLASLVIG